MAHLGLPQVACESSSMESANTGSRFWLCIFDDPISRDNGTSNDEQRAAAISKHGSIMKLRDPAGYALNVQTPWIVGDLGDVMIKRNQEDPEHPLAVRIDPVMTIKPEAKHKPLLELTRGGCSPELPSEAQLEVRARRNALARRLNFFRRNTCASGLKKMRESSASSPKRR